MRACWRGVCRAGAAMLHPPPRWSAPHRRRLPPAMAASLPPGTTLRDRYVIDHAIGRGGMGSIYQAEDGRLPGRICAVKEVEYDADLPERLRDESREQFYREASVLARLDHPNLPKVSDYFTEGGRDYIVMDFVPGDDLKSLMDDARRAQRFLEPPLVVDWGLQLLDALDYMHHQDPPVIAAEVERPPLWAMPPPPDNRPADASTFREALQAAPSAAPATLTPEQTWRLLLARLTPLDRAIGFALAAALLLGILASLS